MLKQLQIHVLVEALSVCKNSSQLIKKVLSMKIATWNVNSLKVRLELVKEWLHNNQPDFLLLQEVKTLDENLFKHLESIGYYCYYNLQKTYNGVATITKKPCNVSKKSIPLLEDNQARFIEVISNDIKIINCYIPNGNPIDTEKYPYKIRWLEALYEYIKKQSLQDKKIIIAGDFNIAPNDIDIYSPNAFKNDALTQKEIRNIYFSMLNLGLTDIIEYKYGGQEKIYTWWDYRHGSFAKNNGIRIDHILLSPSLADKYKDCFIDKNPRTQERPSDHTPVVCELDC